MPCCLTPMCQIYAESSHMELHLFSTGNKRLAEASPLDPVRGIGLRADDPRASDPHKWRGKHSLGEAISAVREAIRASEAGSPHLASLAGSAAPPGMLESMKSRPLHSRAQGPQSALAKSLFRIFGLFFGRTR